MAAKKNTYINVELDWSEKQLLEWKKYVESHPVSKLRDRTRDVITRFGPGEVVVQTIEQQGKFLQETMKNYLSLLEVVNNLREKEEQKQINVRGDQSLSPFESGDL
jgi:hypothetical protein